MQDLLPELCDYQDEGCGLAGSCLSCPLPRCIYDEPQERHKRSRKVRDEEVKHLYRVGRAGVGELARRFGLSRRTIYRILERGER